LPVTDGQEDVEAAILTPAEAAHSGTVLLVDDEPLVRASTAHMLSELGYRVVEAVSPTRPWFCSTARISTCSSPII
jgi:PleD family two-component response regulator